jgi:hypothetical protein
MLRLLRLGLGATPPVAALRLRLMKSKTIWTLTDFRRWWCSGARGRWMRAVRLAPARNLTNFGDIL